MPAKERRRQAEVAGEAYFREILNCHEWHRAMRTRFARQDFYASDVMGRTDAENWFAQVTVGQVEAVRQRRRKLERTPQGRLRSWKATDRVLVLQLVERPSPVNASILEFFFRVHEYIHPKRAGQPEDVGWKVWPEAVAVPREWFKAHRGKAEAEDDD